LLYELVSKIAEFLYGSSQGSFLSRNFFKEILTGSTLYETFETFRGNFDFEFKTAVLYIKEIQELLMKKPNYRHNPLAIKHQIENHGIAAVL